ncbi:MAG: pentapeptide repeat-containing protein, partial [Planctomycetaceae bacterium]|nr:pentapeptide repeat-containing protein [Planctomycetaceae bacterium]
EADFRGIDLSDFTITQCRFFKVDLKDVNFSNAVITGSDFKLAKNLTVAQIKSTWNYKHNQMDKIILPKDIQDELDKEKKK